MMCRALRDCCVQSLQLGVRVLVIYCPVRVISSVIVSWCLIMCRAIPVCGVQSLQLSGTVLIIEFLIRRIVAIRVM